MWLFNFFYITQHIQSHLRWILIPNETRLSVSLHLFFSHFKNTHFRMWDTLLTVWIFMNEWKISCLQNGDTFSSDCSAYLCEITAIVRLKPGRWFSTFFMSSSAWPSTLGTLGKLLLAISSVVSYSWGDNCGGSETILVILTHTGLISVLN